MYWQRRKHETKRGQAYCLAFFYGRTSGQVADGAALLPFAFVISCSRYRSPAHYGLL
jgi:hypothetical protein